MAKYNSKSVYGTLFTMLDNLSEENQDYLMENVFDGDFLEDVKSNPKKAYDVLNKVVINIEDGKKDKVSELLSEYKDKIYMMKNMLKNYGNFKEKIMKESKEKFIIWSNEGYLDFEGEPKENIPSDEDYMIFDDKKDAEKYVDSLKKKYDNKWSDSLEVHDVTEMFEESVKEEKEEKESIKESFEYEGAIPLEELMDILDDEWKHSNNGGVFGNSSHWDDEARDEDRYIEISAIVDFNSASNWGFANKHVQKLYDDECNKIYKEVDEDYDAYDDILNEYDPILFVLTIDLKELLVYADVDLGNGLGSTEVAREKLADNEKNFRKQIQRMIDAF